MLKKLNDVTAKWLPLIVGMLFLIYIIIRAVVIPITHDESNTCLTFSVTSVKDIVTYSDPIPNNHILNTLLIKLFSKTFGMTPFVVRLPNILGFILYFTVIYIWFRKLTQNALLMICGIVLMTCNPFLIDFFSLARGYALSIAFMITSLYFAWKFLKYDTKKDITWSVIFAAIAVYTNFTILNYYLALCMLLCIVILRRKYAKYNLARPFFIAAVKKIMPILLTTIVLVVCSYIPIKKMIDTDQFQFWGTRGFYSDTLVSLVSYSRYGITYLNIPNNVFVNWIIYINIFLCLCAVFILVRKKTSAQKNIFIFTLFILFATVGINILQFYCSHVPYLNQRTALFYYPLIVLPVFCALAEIQYHKPYTTAAIACLFIVVGSAHMARAVNTSSCIEWWFDANTKTVLNYLELEHEKTHEDISLNTNWLFYPSFNFHVTARNYTWLQLTPFHKDVQPRSDTEYYYAYGDEQHQLDSAYVAIKGFNFGDRTLMQKK